MNEFTVYPAIDLRAGKVVRLVQGDPLRQTIYGNDPKACALRWKDEGAKWVHVVNLSGAFEEDSTANLDALQRILECGMNVEYGGGIRDEEALVVPLEMGVRRVFLGTAAIQDPSLAERAIARFGPGRIAADIAVSDDKVMVKGWQVSTRFSAIETGERIRDLGIEWCVLTNVKRDGVEKGVDFSSAVKLQERSGLHVVVSGGVSSEDDVFCAREQGLAGVIVGRALYAGQITLRDALSACKDHDGAPGPSDRSRNDHNR